MGNILFDFYDRQNSNLEYISLLYTYIFIIFQTVIQVLLWKDLKKKSDSQNNWP
jgi:hypothetical protein